MPTIRPISDLRNNFNSISEACHKNAEPIFISKNGKGDMVVMSMALYEQQVAQLDLYKKLLEAETQSASTNIRKSHESLMSELREKLNE
ncbi:MAG: type II toxin-antitoxin system Phd/YefM family antitoxin [Youngiibacter sp.]|jgi:prevent-host-death family protein|nr:type II toxin-antitoxin system Phd/YefM family antitoxin [Youngiibacter sp.]